MSVSLSDAIFLGQKAASMELDDAVSISRVNIDVDSEHYYTAGTDEGAIVNVQCPWGSEAMAQSILNAMSAYTYRPYTATDALLDPAAELGDAITVGGIYSIIASLDIDYNRASIAEIAAPGLDEIDDEYPYITQERKQTNKVLAQARSLIQKSSDKINLSVEALSGEVNSLAVTLDGVTIEGPGGTTLIDGGKIDADELHVNAANINGTLSANQINMTGAITWSDLASDAQSKVNSAQNAADSAQSTANSAQSTANSVSNRVSSWTYPGSTQINGSSIMTGTVTASTIRGGSVQLLGSSGLPAGTLSLTSASSGSYSVQIASGAAMRLQANGGVVWIEGSTGAYVNVATNVVFGSNIQPGGDGAYSCGTASSRWSQLYATTPSISTSDRREKTDINYDVSAYDAIFDALKPASFKFVNGTSGRTHTGFISQDIEDVLGLSGLTSTDFATFIKSPLEDKEGHIIEGEYRYGVRYEELIALCVAQIQALKKRVSELEAV